MALGRSNGMTPNRRHRKPRANSSSRRADVGEHSGKAARSRSETGKYSLGAMKVRCATVADDRGER